MVPSRKIGLLVGSEEAFPAAFMGHVGGRAAGVTAELCSLGGTRLDDPCGYAVIVDRVSQEVPYYRTYLRHAALAGAAVINDPAGGPADDAFLGTALLARLGIGVPRTVILPNKGYGPDVGPAALRNLQYPLPWERLVEYVGLPAVLRPATWGGGPAYRVHSLEEVWRSYDQTGARTMMLQEEIVYDRRVRCLCVGRREILPVLPDLPQPPDPSPPTGDRPPTPALEARLVRDARRISEALGSDVHAVDFAVRDGVPYAVDIVTPAPGVERGSLPEAAFAWMVEKIADLAIAYATGAERPPGRRETTIRMNERGGPPWA